MLQREWSGRRVELLRDMRTKGGIEFKAGEVLEASTAYRGLLNLHDPATMKGNLITRAIFRVNKRDVRLLPADEPANTGVHPSSNVDGYVEAGLVCQACAGDAPRGKCKTPKCIGGPIVRELVPAADVPVTPKGLTE